MPSSAPSHARKTKVVKSANASALAASKASKAQRPRRAAPLQPFKQQRVLRIIKECIKEATAEGGELHDLLLTLKEGASLKMRKAAGVVCSRTCATSTSACPSTPRSSRTTPSG